METTQKTLHEGVEEKETNTTDLPASEMTSPMCNPNTGVQVQESAGRVPIGKGEQDSGSPRKECAETPGSTFAENRNTAEICDTDTGTDGRLTSSQQMVSEECETIGGQLDAPTENESVARSNDNASVSAKTTSSLAKSCQESYFQSMERLMQFAEVLYKCKLCMTLPSILTSKDNFLNHMKEFHVKVDSADDFDCDECDLKFRTLEDFGLHLKLVHGTCNLCGQDSVDTFCANCGAINLDKSERASPACPECGPVETCDKHRDTYCTENESDPDDVSVHNPSSDASNSYEIRSSKPRMFNFQVGRVSKSRDRKGAPKRRVDTDEHVSVGLNHGVDKNLFVNVENDASAPRFVEVLRDGDSVCESESVHSKKRNTSHILSPGQTHTIHWGRGTSEAAGADKQENTEPVCKRIKVLDTVVKIPNVNSDCAEGTSSDIMCSQSDKVDIKKETGEAEGGHGQGTPLPQAVSAIHDMEKYSKYLSRKSFFSLSAHEKLKSSAIYNLISTHMQKDAENNQSNTEKQSQSDAPDDVTKNYRSLCSASDRLKSFIKHQNEDVPKKRRYTSTDSAMLNLESFVKIEPDHRDATSASASASRSCELFQRNAASLKHLNKSAAAASLDLRKSNETLHIGATKMSGSRNQFGSSRERDGVSLPSNLDTKQIGFGADASSVSMNVSPSATYTYKCFQCDMYFADLSSYCGHCKRLHDSHLLHGTPIPKMEQSIAIVKVIQTILVATHSGHVSRNSLLKEVAKEIGSTQVESWGAACNRAVKEVFPYVQTLRKGKYKNTYYFGVKFTGQTTTGDDPLETEEEKPTPPSDSVWGNRQIKTPSKEGGVDLERINRIVPELLIWHGGQEVKVARSDLIDILCDELNEPDATCSSWGWQCNRAVRLYFPQVMIERKGKYKQTYYLGLSFKDPDTIANKLADISQKRADFDHAEEDHVDEDFKLHEEVDRSESDGSDSEPSEDDETMKDSKDTEAHKMLKLRVCRAIASTKGPLTTPRAVQKKLNNVSTVIVKAMLEELDREGYGMIEQPAQPRGRNKVVFFKSYPGTMREEDLLAGTGISSEQYRESFYDLSDPPIRGMYHRHPQADLMADLIEAPFELESGQSTGQYK